MKLGSCKSNPTAGPISIPERRFSADAGEGSASAQVERFYVAAAGELLDAGDNFGAMVEKFVPDHSMRREHEEHVALEAGRVRIRGGCLSDQFDPVVANRLLRRGAADLMFLKQLLDDVSEGLGRALPGATWLIRCYAPKIGDEVFGDFAERVGLLLGHGGGTRTW